MADTKKLVSRDDLEAKFRSIQTDMVAKVESKKQTVVASGALVAFVVLFLVYVFGRRAGKKRTTLVEIRRV